MNTSCSQTEIKVRGPDVSLPDRSDILIRFSSNLEQQIGILIQSFPTGESIEAQNICDAFGVTQELTDQLNFDKLGRLQAIMQVIATICFDDIGLKAPDTSQIVSWSQPDATNIFMGNQGYLIVCSEESSGSGTLYWQLEGIRNAFMLEFDIAAANSQS